MTIEQMKNLARNRNKLNEALVMFAGFHSTGDIKSAEPHRQAAIEYGELLLETLDELHPMPEGR